MDKLDEIFARQEEYMHRLQPTYQHNGFSQHFEAWPWPLNGRHSQEEFRLLAWRYTEEMFEALDARDPSDTLEEFADALHFLIELCLCSGVSRKELLSGTDRFPWTDSDIDSLEEFFGMTGKSVEDFCRSASIVKNVPLLRMSAVGDAVRGIARACMTLKQRPWRTDERPTESSAWLLGMHMAFKSYVIACTVFEITAQDLYNAYFEKGAINDQRVIDHGFTQA